MMKFSIPNKLTSWSIQLASFFRERNFETNTLGFARSLLAFGLLITLITNPISNFFYTDLNGNPLSPVLLQESFVNKINFFLLWGYEDVLYMKIFAIIILLTVISGYFIRITSILHWWVTWSFMLFSSAIDGGDQIASNLSLLLIPICILDSRNNHWISNDIKDDSNDLYKKVNAYFFILLIRLQMAIIYFHAAVGKFSVQEWAEGTAVYYWFNNSIFGMPNYLHPLLDPILHNQYGVLFVTHGVMIFELLLFSCLTMATSKRKYLFVPAIIFHFSIIIIHGIFSFFFSMAAGLTIYLLDINRSLSNQLGR